MTDSIETLSAKATQGLVHIDENNLRTLRIASVEIATGPWHHKAPADIAFLG